MSFIGINKPIFTTERPETLRDTEVKIDCNIQFLGRDLARQSTDTCK